MPDYIITQQDRGQSFEAEAGSDATSLRPRLRPIIWPRDHLGLENLVEIWSQC